MFCFVAIFIPDSSWFGILS